MNSHSSLVAQTLAVREAGIQRAIAKIRELDAANKKVCFALLYFNCMRAFKASDVVCVSACVSVARACVRRACVCVGASVCACVCMRVCVQVLQYFTCRINHTFFSLLLLL